MLIRGFLILIAVYWTGYWIAGLAVAVLLLIWQLLSTGEGPPVLALALTYQWMQVTIGLFYWRLTGVELDLTSSVAGTSRAIVFTLKPESASAAKGWASHRPLLNLLTRIQMFITSGLEPPTVSPISLMK